MTNQAKVKIYAVKSRHTINLPGEFVRDSAFPFKVGEELIARDRRWTSYYREEASRRALILATEPEWTSSYMRIHQDLIGSLSSFFVSSVAILLNI